MDQSLIWLFQRFTTLLRSPDLDQSLIWLFIEDLRRMDLDQSLIWLFGQQLRALGLDQSLIWLFGGDINTLNSTDSGHLDQSLIWLFDENTAGSFFGHGTVVAGLLHLVAPEADLVPIRAFDAGGNSSLFLTTAGVYAAVAQGADVINMSFSIGTGSMAFRRALNFATSRGVALVASAGNSAMDASNVFPAAYPAVAAVGATDFEDRIAEFSNFGKVIDLVAPGKNVVSTYPGGLYATASGTSFSAPMVSGAIAVLMSGGYQGNAAVPALENAADEVDSVNPDYVRQLGRGRINLKGAFESR
jgi:subtilisin family serine protease